MKLRAIITAAAIAVAVLFITNAAQAQISRHFPDPLTVSTATISVLYATNTYIPQGSCHFFDSGTDTVKTCYDGTYLYSSGAEYKVDTLTSLGLSSMASGTFGGGYGSTGSTFDVDGNAWFNGNVTVDGSLTFGAVSATNIFASGFVAASASMYIDQGDYLYMGTETIGYDGTDIDLSADTTVAGNIVATGYASATSLYLSGTERITAAGVSDFASETIGGGYGSTGISFTPTGDGWFNGDLTVDGSLSSGDISASDIQATGFVAASDSMYVDQSDAYYMGTESISYDGTDIDLSTDTTVAGDLTATGEGIFASSSIGGGCWGTGICLETDGDIYADGDITANAYHGDGSALTGIAPTLQEVTDEGDTTTDDITTGGLNVAMNDRIYLDSGTDTIYFGLGTGNKIALSGAINQTSPVAAQRIYEIRPSGSQEGMHIEGTTSANMFQSKNDGPGNSAYFKANAGGKAIYVSGQTIAPYDATAYIQTTWTSATKPMVLLEADDTVGYLIQAKSKIDGAADRTAFFFDNDGDFAGGGDVNKADLGTNAIFASGTIETTDGLIIDGNETMDAYDEGTYTVTVTGNTITGDCATGTTGVGQYTRIGNMVHVDMQVSVTACAIEPTGILRLSLPSGLTPSSLSNYRAAGAVGFINNYGNLDADNILTLWVAESTEYIYLYQTSTDGTGVSSIAPADYAWSGYFSVTYLMD